VQPPGTFPKNARGRQGPDGTRVPRGGTGTHSIVKRGGKGGADNADNFKWRPGTTTWVTGERPEEEDGGGELVQ